MLKTHGCNNKLKKNIGKINFTNLREGLLKTIKVYKSFGI